MDKFDNETLDEYALKNNLFKIYTDNEKQIIDVCYPNPKITNGGFIEFIKDELYTLRNKYNLGYYSKNIKLENMTTERKEDINRQQWLFKELEFWERKKCEVINKDKDEIIRKENDKNRFFELKTIISETHKEQLDELITLFSFNVQYTLNEEKKQIEKKKRIKLYQNFMKNKKIYSEISVLEEKINNLKEELVL